MKTVVVNPIILYYAMLCNVMLCYVCNVCYVCYVMLCYVMFVMFVLFVMFVMFVMYYVMLCYVNLKQNHESFSYSPILIVL